MDVSHVLVFYYMFDGVFLDIDVGCIDSNSYLFKPIIDTLENVKLSIRTDEIIPS